MKPLLWADVETTGLSPQLHSLLEVALVATDEDLRIEDSICLVLLCNHLPADPKVLKMHTENGLLAEARHSQITLEQADEELAAWAYDGYSNRPLAGSNPEFDRRFLNFYLPTLSTVFHYRNYDVNTLAMFCNQEKPKTTVHRALQDLERDIEFVKILKRITQP